MAIATEEETRQEGAEEIRISNDRELYRAIGRIEGKQEMLVSSVRSLEEQARENYRLLDAKIDSVKADLDAKIDGVKGEIKGLDDKFNRLTLGIVGGVIVIIVANYLMQYLPRIG